jgi:thiol-disulfide isomerase/thioredoxin
MTKPFTRRQFAGLSAGLAAAGLFGKSAWGEELPDAAGRLEDVFPADPPAFSFTDAAGKRLGFADYRGRGLLVNFWATWCGPCKAEMPTLAAINKTLMPDGILVLPISVDASGAAAVEPYFTANHIEGLPVLLDPSSNALALFHAKGIPLSLVINRQGQIVARTLGGADWNTAATASKLRRMVGPDNRTVTTRT